MARSLIKEAVEEKKENDMKSFLGKDCSLYAELFVPRGDKSKARENLGKAIEIFKEFCAEGWVKKYGEELAALS